MQCESELLDQAAEHIHRELPNLIYECAKDTADKDPATFAGITLRFQSAILAEISKLSDAITQPILKEVRDIAKAQADFIEELRNKDGVTAAVPEFAELVSNFKALLPELARRDTEHAGHYAAIEKKADTILGNLAILAADVARILQYLRESLPGLISGGAPHFKIQPPRTLPARASRLFGRETLVGEVLTLLRDHRQIAVTGAGGMGKTALCAEVIGRFSEYPATAAQVAGGLYYFDFYRAQGLGAFVSSIVQQAGLPVDDPRLVPGLAALALQQKGVLLYIEGGEKLDDLESLFSFLHDDTRLIFTTRYPSQVIMRPGQVPRIRSLPVPVIAFDEAAKALHYYADETSLAINGVGTSISAEHSGWLSLAEFLGGHALACTIAGSTCGRDALSPDELLKQLKKVGLETLGPGKDSRDSLAILFRRTVEALSPAARRAWSALTFAGANPTPLQFLQALEVTDRPPLTELVQLGLAKTSRAPSPETGEDEPAYALAHALLGEWGRTALAEYGIKRDEVLGKAMKWAMEYWGKFTKTEGAICHLEQYAIVAPIADAILREVEPLTDIPADVLGRFYYLPARMHRHHGQFALAEPIYHRCVERMKEVAGKSSPKYATAISNLALLLQATNRLAEAEPMMRRALEIDEQSYGKSHPTVAIRLNNLAHLLQDTNRLAEAEPLMRRALEMDEQSYGKSHPAVARDLSNLAHLLQATNRLAEAEPLMRRALAIDEQSYGKSHPTVAIRLSNLATLLKDTNRLAEAEPLMRRALEIFKASYGESHPNVAVQLNNLARLLHDTNQLAEAEPMMRRALAIDEQSYGKSHPLVATRLNNLALLLQDTNRLAEAEPLMRRALEIFKASYGESHPNVAKQLNNLAQLLKDTNRLEEAEPMMRRHVVIFLQFTVQTGHEHPHLRDALRGYVVLCQQMEVPVEEFWPRLVGMCREAGMDEETAKKVLASAFQ